MRTSIIFAALLLFAAVSVQLAVFSDAAHASAPGAPGSCGQRGGEPYPM